MRIGLTAKGAGLGAWLDPHFGRCQQVVLVDENNRFEAWTNPSSERPGGAGISMAKRLADSGCTALITGVINPEAFEYLKERGIPVYLVGRGILLELIEALRDGDLSPASEKDVEASFQARGSECR